MKDRAPLVCTGIWRSLVMTTQNAAPELLVDKWFNTDHPLTLSGLRGRVVVLAAFQVLCPNSIASGVPQARRIYETFATSDVAVIGMHTTFEHHDAFNCGWWGAFIQEYRLNFRLPLISRIPPARFRIRWSGTRCAEHRAWF